MSYQNYLDAYNLFYELKDKYDKKRASTIKTLKKKHPNNYVLIKEELQKFINLFFDFDINSPIKVYLCNH